MPARVRIIALALTLAGAAGLTALISRRSSGPTTGRSPPAPVTVGAIEHGRIDLTRTYSGTLAARAIMVVAPKVSGRIDRIAVDLGDVVKSGQVVAELDDDELRHLAAQAAAELQVAKATLSEATHAAELAARELAGMETLRKRQVISQAQLDTARTNGATKAAAVDVAAAQVARAAAAKDAAATRLSYSKIRASWEGDDARVVGARYVDPGATVAANTKLLSIVALDPIEGVVFVSEQDYAHVAHGQAVTLKTDAYPGATFDATVERIAPVFSEGSRQARVELTVPNADGRLKPGMFIRATIVLETRPDALTIPREALTARGGATGVFLVSDDGATVSWCPVKTGIEGTERIELLEPPLSGRVVTLGQQLLDDGSHISIPAAK